MTERLPRGLLIVLVAMLTATLQAGAAQAGSEPVLREQVKVYSDLVVLGDLFENAGDAASAPVFRSPELGTKGVVAAGRVAAAAKQHGLEWSNPGAISEVVVDRPGRLISLEDISDLIGKHTGGAGEPWSVEFSRRTRPFHIDPRIKAPIVIKHIDVNARSGKFRAVIGTEGHEFPSQEHSFTGRTYASVEAVVPARVIERDAIIAAGDLKTIRLPLSGVPSSAIENADDAIGMAARQRLAIDRPVRTAEIEPPKLVRRNALVTIEYRAPGLLLKSKGKALADAAQGQTVAIMNLRSKRTVEAQVTGAGLVSVSGDTPRPVRAAGRKAASAAGKNTFVIR